MRTKRSIKDSLKEYLNWCVGKLLLGGNRDDTVRDMVDAISDEIASGGGGGLDYDLLKQALTGAITPDGYPFTISTSFLGAIDKTYLTGKLANTYADKVHTHLWADITDRPTSLPPGGNAGGDLAGTYPNPTIGTGKVTTAKIADKAVTAAKLADQYIVNRGAASDLNSAVSYGIYTYTSSTTNAPTGYGSVLVTEGTGRSSNPVQLALGYSTGNANPSIFLRYRASLTDWSNWVEIWKSNDFNPENYLPLSGNKMITGDFQFKDGVSVRDAAGRSVVGLLDVAGDGVCVVVGNIAKKTRIVTPNDTPVYRNDGKGSYKIYDSGNLGNATTSQAGLMSAADKTKLDGLSDQINVVGQASSTYIFPGDPSKFSEVDPPTNITSILGTASDFLDAFNNGKVFVSKTVTFSGVSVPSDITYNVLKSEDPDNPTIFQIIMSTVVWGHYIEITIDFENNEYQAISNTINGIIGVNNTGTTN